MGDVGLAGEAEFLTSITLGPGTCNMRDVP